MKDKQNYIIFGSSSELAKTFIKGINSNHTFCLSNRKSSDGKNFLYIKDYLDNIDEIIEFCRKAHNPIVIFFNGYLKEDRPNLNPTNDQILKTFEINYLVPFEITKKLINEGLDIKKFVYISSFAAVKLRYKNFNYGSAKKLLEESIKSLDLTNYLIIRFGKINTKMSESHSSSIFDLDKDEAAKVLLKKIKHDSGLRYPNLITKILSVFIKFLPYKFLKYFQL